jgi:hypothetical protein
MARFDQKIEPMLELPPPSRVECHRWPDEVARTFGPCMAKLSEVVCLIYRRRACPTMSNLAIASTSSQE